MDLASDSSAVREAGLLALVGEIYDSVLDAVTPPVCLDTLASTFQGTLVKLWLADDSYRFVNAPGPLPERAPQFWTATAPCPLNPCNLTTLENFVVWEYSDKGVRRSIPSALDTHVSPDQRSLSLCGCHHLSGCILSNGLRPACCSCRFRTGREQVPDQGQLEQSRDNHSSSMARTGVDEHLSIGLLVARSAEDRPFHDGEWQLFRLLLDHLVRALQLRQQFCQSRDAHEALVDILRHLSSGVLLLDGQERLLFCNGAAERIFERDDGLTLDGDGLCATSNRVTATLRQLICDALCADPDRCSPSPRALALPRPSGKPDLIARVIRIRLDQGQAGIAVFVTDPEMASTVRDTNLLQVYDFTPAEARLAAALARGRTPTEAATDLGLSVHTVRGRIRALFAKTGSRGQCELVCRLLTGPASSEFI